MGMQTVIPTCLQVLTSLAFLHSLGLIHSDLKPENILIKSYSRSDSCSSAAGPFIICAEVPIAMVLQLRGCSALLCRCACSSYKRHLWSRVPCCCC